MAGYVEPSFLHRWLDPPGEPAAFAPTPAAICGGCGLGVGRTASLVQEPGSGTVLCPICRLGRDPATPPGALVRRKDPLEYRRKLRFHQKVASARDYGLEDA